MTSLKLRDNELNWPLHFHDNFNVKLWKKSDCVCFKCELALLSCSCHLYHCRCYCISEAGPKCKILECVVGKVFTLLTFFTLFKISLSFVLDLGVCPCWLGVKNQWLFPFVDTFSAHKHAQHRRTQNFISSLCTHSCKTTCTHACAFKNSYPTPPCTYSHTLQHRVSAIVF